MWAHTALRNSTRTFIFKLHNNTAGYNLSVSHLLEATPLIALFVTCLKFQRYTMKPRYNYSFSVLQLRTLPIVSFLGSLMNK
jgi:hypothetical protein